MQHCTTPCVGLLHQPQGRSAFAPPLQTGDPCVGPRETPLDESRSHPWASQSGSRHAVKAGAVTREMEAPPRGGGADLEGARPGSRDLTLSTLVVPRVSSLHSADVAEALSVRLSPDCSAPGSSGENAPGWGSSSLSSPVLAGPSMILGPDFPS